MLVSMKEILDEANKGNFGVAAPNVNTELDARAVFEAAEELNSPIIIDIATDANPDISFLCDIVRRMAENSKVPVAINLDHSKTIEQAITGIRSGFTSIMVDRSVLSFEENIKEVKEIVDIAHAVGVSVEAELGMVGQAYKYDQDRNVSLTEPDKAAEFIKRTGVDCLAVAVGNAHGAYSGHKPYLDFERLIAVKEATKAPLVMHGGSGTGDEQLHKACSLGINKVNISNDLLQCICKKIKEEDFSGNRAYNLWEVQKQAYKQRLKELIVLFGSKDKSWKVEPKGFEAKEIVMRETN